MSIAKVCKFQLEKKEISYDCGETWNPTSTKRKIEGREPVERNSRDCGFQESRETVVSGYTCNGYDKYTQLVDIVSYDGGETWDVISGSSRLGTLVERFSSDCCQLRTVSATVCTELFRKANVDIQEASLDGETWIPTGRYTVTQYLDEYNIDCMNEYEVKFLGVPTSGTTGASFFVYNMYKNDICDTVTSYDPTCNSATGNTLIGDGEGYVVIGCDSLGNTFCVTSRELNDSSMAGSFTEDEVRTIIHMKYIFIADCANNPCIARGNDERNLLNGSTYLPYASLEKIFISSGVTGTLTHNACWYGNPSLGLSALTEIVGLGDSQITYIDERMFEDCPNLRSVHLPRTLYCLDLGAFRGCTAMTSVTIDSRALRDLKESYQDLYYQQFANCTSLQTVTFPNDYYGVIYKQMFYDCPSLTAVTLGNPSEIRDRAFQGCSSLTSIDLGDRVTSIGSYAFAGCTSLADIYIGQTENILSHIGNNAFPSGCTVHVPCDAYPYWHQAYDIDHPELGVHIAYDTACTTTYRWVESGSTCDCVNNNRCALEIEQYSTDSGETWINTGNERQGAVTEYDCMECGYIPSDFVLKAQYSNGNYMAATGGTSITSYIANMNQASANTCVSGAYTKCWIGSGVTSIARGAFSNKTSITSIEIPNSVTSIDQGAFVGCSSLTSVTIPTGITIIRQGTFASCTSLSSITIPNGVTTIYGEGGPTPEYYHTGAFQGCSGLTSITIPDSVTYIGGWCFSGCRSLRSVTIGSGISTIERLAFLNCTGLTSITIMATTPPTLPTDGGGGQFMNTNDCPIYVPPESVNAYKTASGWSSYANRISSFYSSVTAKYDVVSTSNPTKIGYDDYTSGFSSIKIDGVAQQNVVSAYTFNTVGEHTVQYTLTDPTTIGTDAFFGCDRLTNALIFGDVTTIGQAAFSICYSLSSVTIPDSVTSIGNAAFYYCTGLTTCTIGSGVTTIGYNAFNYCSSLSGDLVISDSVTSIDSNAFFACSNITSVTIGSGITYFGSSVFNGCGGLTSVIIQATTPPTLNDANAFTNPSNYPIYVPFASVDAYKAASGWSSLASRIEAIPFKWKATYSDSSVVSADCVSSNEIAYGEINGTNLVSLEIGSCATSIGQRAVSGCSTLREIVIPDTVTNIGYGAFFYCNGATACTIGSGVTNIDESAFDNCSSLASITIFATTPPTLGSYAFYKTNECPIYVPAASVNAYKGAGGYWYGYRERIQAIPNS